MTEQKSSQKKATRIGLVVKDSLDKTLTVTVERLVQHPLIKKYIKRRTRVLVHDENNTAKVGDKVKIMEGRPVSKHKRWHLSEVMQKNETALN